MWIRKEVLEINLAKMTLIKVLINSILLTFTILSVFSSGCTEKKNDIVNQNNSVNQDKTAGQDDTVSWKTGIIFREDFESFSINQVQDNWDDKKYTEDMSFSNDVPEGSKGKQSLMMTYIAGKNEGGHLFKSFPKGYETLYARFYIKFLTRNSKIHHLVKLGGYYPVTQYPQGFAGLKPNGKDFFISGIESPESKDWGWGFYTYWMHMHGSINSKYWGNVFLPESIEIIPKGKWICVEFMIKMNNPVEEFNGEQAFWVNGKKILELGKGFPKIHQNGGYYKESSSGQEFEGFQWRIDDKLKLNFFWLNYYMTKGVEGEIDQILFDDIVISTKYIGPMNSSKKINIKNKATSLELE